MKTMIPRRTRQVAPWSELENLDRRLRSLLGGTMEAESALPLAPAVDLKESNGGYELTAELPGLEPEQVEVTVENGVVTLRGEKKQEKEEGEEGKWHLWERSYGSFERSFALPRGIDEGKVEAQFDKGVLKVTVPKKAGSKGKKIPIGI